MRRYVFLSLCATLVLSQSIDPSADAFSILFSNDSSIGPDGPWYVRQSYEQEPCLMTARWYIPQAIDYPDQVMNLLPGLAQLSLIISDNACASETAACPLPLPNLWGKSGAWEVSNGLQTISSSVSPSEWDTWKTALLRLQGSGKFFWDRMTLHENGVDTATAFLDQQGMMLSDSFKATFPGGAAYTLDTGYVSTRCFRPSVVELIENSSPCTRVSRRSAGRPRRTGPQSPTIEHFQMRISMDTSLP